MKIAGEDRRWHKQRMGEVDAALEQLDDKLHGQIRDLADDDYAGTEDVRARLAEAKVALDRARGSVQAALEQFEPAGDVVAIEGLRTTPIEGLPYPEGPLASRRVVH